MYNKGTILGKGDMLPLSVGEEWSYRAIALTDILFLLPTAISYMTRKFFARNNYYLKTKHLTPYPTWMLPVFQG